VGRVTVAGRPWVRPLGVAAGTTVVVTALAYLLPEGYAATGVGLGFFAATWLVVLRRDDTESIRRHGLGLGGVLEPEPLEARRILRETAGALAWALGLALVVFPPFWLGYLFWWRPTAGFAPAWPRDPLDELLGQLVVIAIPEEAFYRGYLQTALDDAWPPRWRVLGARLGPSLLVASALFALGHYATEMHPNRLAVFFPALVFGWLRAKTGGIGAPVAFHLACNVFAAFLGRSYGLHS
jgi:hypothetical protein